MENNKRKRSEKNISYQRRNHFSFLKSLRKDNKLCDVTIKVGEQTFRAHKIILVGAIDYFEKMFLNDFVESKQEIITIQNVKPCNMELFLKFAYTGQITIKEVNAQGLMIDASFLGLTDIMNECSKFLESYLTPNNALEIYFLAEALNCTSLHDESYKYVQKNFSDILLADQYLDLSIDNLKEIISSNNSHSILQEKVFEAVMRWVKNNVKERKKYLLDLLKIIELSKITDIYLVEKVIDDELISSLVECRDFVNKVIHNQIKSKNQRHILLIARSYKSSGVTIELYHPITNEWNAIQTINNRGYDNNYIVYENKVYIFSVDSRGTSIVFDYKEMSLKAISSMHNKRQMAGVVALNGHLYVCGGGSPNKPTNTVERYCPMTDQWEIMSSLNHPRSDMATVSLQGYIYVVGGYDNIINSSNTVERYDPQSNKWTIIDSTMLKKRLFPGAGVLNEKIYVCGGIHNYGVLSSVEVYDPKLNSWEYVASMNEARYGPVVVAHMNKLWAFGTICNVDGSISSVEVYDPENNIWSYVSPPENELRFLAGGVISIQ